MLKLYTGKPGSFKTAKAVSDAMRFVKEGRPVYTNIDNFDYEGVQKLPDSLDWADCPHGSVVIYDEAQQFEFLQYKGREKLSSDQRVKGLETHRHQGYDIILVTQSPSFLHNHVLSLVGEHYHLHRAYGRSYADVFLWRYTAHSPDSTGAKNKAESHEKFKPESKLFDNYQSTTIDTHKLKVPVLYWKLGGFLLAVIALILYMVFGSSNPFLSAHQIKDNFDQSSGKKLVESQASSVSINEPQGFGGLDERTEQQRRADFNKQLEYNREQLMKYNVNKPYDIDYTAFQYQVQQVPQLSGCAIIDKKCTCYSQQATRLDISQTDCKRYMNGDKPFNPFKQVNTNENFTYAQSNNSGNSPLSSQQNPAQISLEEYAKFQEYQRMTQEYQRSQPQQTGELNHGFG